MTLTDKLNEILKRCEAATCPRCKVGELVHDFEDGCWTNDRCPNCNASWWNDPPRDAIDAPYFISMKDTARVTQALLKAIEALEQQKEIDDHTRTCSDALIEIKALLEEK